MTPEDKIIAAIDRNTEAVERQTEWLKLEEVDPSLEVLQDIRNWAKAIWLVIVVMAVIWMFITPAKAAPLLPPLTYEIGTPPLPPPNPHVQYWHTQYVPGPQGVLPVEVYAPRLVAQVEPEPYVFVDIGDPPRLMETPEPGTAEMVMQAIVLSALFILSSEMGKARQKANRYQKALEQIQGKVVLMDPSEIARKALEEEKA